MTIKKIRVTLKFPEIPPSFSEGRGSGHSTTTWDIKAPARDFEGDVNWHIAEGHLSIYRRDGHTGDPAYLQAFITFAAGQWMYVEYLPNPPVKAVG